MDEFLMRALIAGLGIALVSGVVGCFVVWRRMAYFGDSLSHSALLGIAVGLLAGINVNLATIAVCSLFAVLLVWLQHKRVLATDTLLGILAHGALSIGMVAVSFITTQRVDLHSYLFGDVLTVNLHEIIWIYGVGAVVLAVLIWRWSSLVLMTVHEDLAKAEGVKTFIHHLLFMFLMTLVVAVSIRIVGILLITSLLIIPAATARQLVRSPEGMAIAAALLGMAAVGLGLYGSLVFDVPSGPAMVVASTALFVVLMPIGVLRGR